MSHKLGLRKEKLADSDTPKIGKNDGKNEDLDIFPFMYSCTPSKWQRIRVSLLLLLTDVLGAHYFYHRMRKTRDINSYCYTYLSIL